MLPPVYPLVNVPAVRAVAPEGAGNVRLYPFGEAPQGVAYPYGTWQFPSGVPENQLSGTPVIDQVRVQFDLYGESGAQARALATAVRNAIEPTAHCVLFFDQGRDPDTNAFRITASFDLWAARP